VMLHLLPCSGFQMDNESYRPEITKTKLRVDVRMP
jgi:hypothetical protein